MGIVRGKRLGLLHKVRIYEPMSLECSDNNVVTGKDKKKQQPTNRRYFLLVV